MKELFIKIDEYKSGLIDKEELNKILVEHISRLNIEFLEERFGSVENIGSMLGFFEVCNVLYESLEKDLKLEKEEDIHLKVPLTVADRFKEYKVVSINDLIERALGKLKDVHDRKKLTTIKYEVTFKSPKSLLSLSEDLKLVRDRVASLEKHENKLIIFTYEDIQTELVDLLKNKYDCDLKEI